MPHLQVLQEKFAKTGKFTVVGSHVQNYNKKGIDKLLNKNKVTFPVYQQLRVSDAPCGRGIPYMALLDHNGKLIASGHISGLESKIKELIAKIPGAGEILVTFYNKTIEDKVELFARLKREIAAISAPAQLQSTLSFLSSQMNGTNKEDATLIFNKITTSSTLAAYTKMLIGSEFFKI